MTIKFDEIDPEFLPLQKDWAEKYRVPISHGLHPSYYFPAVLWVPLKSDFLTEVWAVQIPDESDAALLGDYIQYRLRRWYSEHQVQHINEKDVLDIDPGVNTITFFKSDLGWHYSMATWRDGPPFQPVRYPQHEGHCATLLDVMKRVERNTTNQAWQDFLAKHETVAV